MVKFYRRAFSFYKYCCTSAGAASCCLLIVFASACKDNDQLPVVRFEAQTVSVNEDDAVAHLTVQLDHPASDDVYVSFDIDSTGTAKSLIDFVIVPVLIIPKGQTSAVLDVNIVNDYFVEAPETVRVSISSAAGARVSDIDGASATDVTIVSDDSGYLQIDLTWDAGDGTAGDVDMDLLLWRETDSGFRLSSASERAGQFETVLLPVDSLDARYGVTFLYYSGSSNNLKFHVKYSVVAGTITGTKEYDAVYKLSNISTSAKWIEQLFEKTGSNFHDLTGITVAASGSRVTILPILPITKEILK